MRQFEQDWLELGSRVARSLHCQHPRNLRLLQAAQAEAKDRAARRSRPSPGDDQCPLEPSPTQPRCLRR
jgi:hypothetical protein